MCRHLYKFTYTFVLIYSFGSFSFMNAIGILVVVWCVSTAEEYKSCIFDSCLDLYRKIWFNYATLFGL